MELGSLLINGHWVALGTHLHATWDILALAPTPSLNRPLVNIDFYYFIHGEYSPESSSPSSGEVIVVIVKL
jgi:hypothetical protein